MEEIDVITLSWLIGSIDGTLEIFFGYFQGTFYSFNKILLATIVDKKSKKILVKMAGKFSGCLQLFISDLNVENFKSSVKKAREDVKDIVRSTKLPKCNERVIQRKVQIILLQ